MEIPTFTRKALRRFFHGVFGLPMESTQGDAPREAVGRADRLTREQIAERKRRRLAEDARKWAAMEAKAARERNEARILESEILRARLQKKGILYPWEL